MTIVVDWSKFDEFPENTNYCRCGTIFQSHSKCVIQNQIFGLFTRKSCPQCRKNNNIRRSCSPKEKWSSRED